MVPESGLEPIRFVQPRDFKAVARPNNNNKLYYIKYTTQYIVSYIPYPQISPRGFFRALCKRMYFYT